MEGAYVTRHVTGDKQTVEIARKLAKLAIAGQLPRFLTYPLCLMRPVGLSIRSVP